MDRFSQSPGGIGLAVIEDAAQAFGAEYRGKPVGRVGEFRNASAFFPTKNLGALGEAGLLVTNDAALAEKARLLRNHGEAARVFHQTVVGGNFRLDAVQAALLAVKLPHLAEYTAGRQRHACVYGRALAALRGSGAVELILPAAHPDRTHIANQYTVRVRVRRLARRRVSTECVAEFPAATRHRLGDLLSVAVAPQECFRAFGPHERFAGGGSAVGGSAQPAGVPGDDRGRAHRGGGRRRGFPCRIP